MSFWHQEPFFSYNDINRLFDDGFGGFGGLGVPENINRRIADRESTTAVEPLRGFRPKIDVHENAETNQITATFELPGLAKEDVTIDVHNNRLIVSGETQFARDVEEGGYVIRERRRGKFSRTLPLPADTQPEQIRASMENGVLTVTFPKSTPEEATKKITID